MKTLAKYENVNCHTLNILSYLSKVNKALSQPTVIPDVKGYYLKKKPTVKKPLSKLAHSSHNHLKPQTPCAKKKTGLNDIIFNFKSLSGQIQKKAASYSNQEPDYEQLHQVIEAVTELFQQLVATELDLDNYEASFDNINYLYALKKTIEKLARTLLEKQLSKKDYTQAANSILFFISCLKLSLTMSYFQAISS